MGTRQNYAYKSTRTIQTTHPTNVSVEPNEPLDNTDDGSTCSMKLYDPAKDEVLTALEAIGQIIWSVTNAGLFVIGEIVELTQNDGTIISGTLDDVDATAGTITSDTATTVAAAAGSQVRKRLGAAITMTEYGTPALEKDDWGFSGVIPSNHAGLVLDLEFDVEVSFVGSVGGGLDKLQRHEFVVKYAEDC